MIHISYEDLEQNLLHYLDQASESRVTLVVPRQAGDGRVVIIAEGEFDGWRETVHLLGSPKNAERLIRASREAKTGELDHG